MYWPFWTLDSRGSFRYGYASGTAISAVRVFRFRTGETPVPLKTCSTELANHCSVRLFFSARVNRGGTPRLAYW